MFNSLLYEKGTRKILMKLTSGYNPIKDKRDSPTLILDQIANVCNNLLNLAGSTGSDANFDNFINSFNDINVFRDSDK